jgi:Cation transporter/ATPase, N-terminus
VAMVGQAVPTPASNGLSTVEAEARLAHDGGNLLPAQRGTPMCGGC